MVTRTTYFQSLFLIILIASCTIGTDRRYRRQINDAINHNSGILQNQPAGSIPLNPINDPRLLNNNNKLNASPPPQVDMTRSRGYYNSPLFQPPPFTGEKPDGWFGTNHVNWVSNRDSELDKNKLAASKMSSPNSFETNGIPQSRDDGGPLFLEKIAKQYSSQGQKAFTFDQYETREGRGAVCSNYENYFGYVFGKFPCPLPAATGMNQLDQFCCGPVNYQYCCNAQEFSQSQRGAYSDPRNIGDHVYPRRAEHSVQSKRIFAIIIPIISVVIVAGIIILVYVYYKKLRQEQNRGKPDGVVRLKDDYSSVPQDPSIDKTSDLHEQDPSYKNNV